MSAVLRKARELRDLVTKDGAVGIRLISPEESASFIFAHRYSYAPPPEIEKEGLARYILGILYSPFSAVSAGEIKKDPLFAARSAASRLSAGWEASGDGIPFRKIGRHTPCSSRAV